MSEGGVGGVWCEGVDVDAVHTYDASEFACGEYGVDVGEVFWGHFGALRLEFFGSAGHDGDAEDLFGFEFLFFGEVVFDDGTEHLLRAFAGGDVWYEFGVVLFDEANPAWRAAGHHGEGPIVLDALSEFGGFFHDGEVCGEGGVEDTVES